MTWIRPTLICLPVLFVCAVNAHAVSKQTGIAESGETILAARSSKFDVRVLVRMRPVEKTTEALVEPGGYVKRSDVDRIEIMVGGKQLFVPHSIYCDLFDLHNAEIRLGARTGILTLEGGDASESFWVKIEFDSKRVKRSSGGSGMMPGVPGKETIYHDLVLKDE
jgi:hypothetical protein